MKPDIEFDRQPVLTGNLIELRPLHPADFAVLNANVDPRRLGHAYSSHGIGGSLGYAVAPIVSFGSVSARACSPSADA